MASARGYLSRLVDEVASRRGRAAHAPRQIAWGPSRPAWQAADDEAGAEPAGRSVPVHRPARTAGARPPQQPGRSLAGHVETPPGPPAEAGLRLVTERPPAREATGPVTGSPARAEPRPPAPPRRPQATPATRTSTDRAGQPDQPRRRDADAPAPAQRPPASPAQLPAAVTDALARLSALSDQVRRDARPATVRPPARQQAPQSPQPAHPVRAEARSTVPAAVVAPSPARERPGRAPQVHIGAIEVTIAAPAPPPAAPVAAPAPQQPAPAAPLGRLSRPGATFGLGQG